jgi:hypothetical protein
VTVDHLEDVLTSQGLEDLYLIAESLLHVLFAEAFHVYFLDRVELPSLQVLHLVNPAEAALSDLLLL